MTFPQPFLAATKTGLFVGDSFFEGSPLELWAAVHGLSIDESAIDLYRALGRPVPRINRW